MLQVFSAGVNNALVVCVSLCWNAVTSGNGPEERRGAKLDVPSHTLQGPKLWTNIRLNEKESEREVEGGRENEREGRER